MTFPGTYNLNYYKGDTLEFRVYPKDASGAAFPLSQFTSDNVKFTIASSRGDDPDVSVEGYTEIAEDNSNILCVITPEIATSLDANVDYVYDIEIARASSPYNIVYTLLTGIVAIEDQVTPVRSLTPPTTPASPGTVTSITVGTITDSSIQVSWSAPTTGGTPTSYRLYIVEYDPSFEGAGLATLISNLSLATPFTTTNTSYTFTQTVATPLGAGVSLEPETAYVFAIVASNSVGNSSPVGNFDATTGVISETFTYPELPGVVTGLTLDDTSSSSLSISWTAPATGGTVEEYEMYFLELIPEYADPEVLQAAIVATLLAGPSDIVPAGEYEATEYTFESLEPATSYLVGVISSNISGSSALVSNSETPYTTDPEES
jgi:hypothetical protein